MALEVDISTINKIILLIRRFLFQNNEDIEFPVKRTPTRKTQLIPVFSFNSNMGFYFYFVFAGLRSGLIS